MVYIPNQLILNLVSVNTDNDFSSTDEHRDCLFSPTHFLSTVLRSSTIKKNFDRVKFKKFRDRVKRKFS